MCHRFDESYKPGKRGWKQMCGIKMFIEQSNITCTTICRFPLRLTSRRSFMHSSAHSLERVPKNSTSACARKLLIDKKITDTFQEHN
jgi:hypothetical protein